MIDLMSFAFINQVKVGLTVALALFISALTLFSVHLQDITPDALEERSVGISLVFIDPTVDDYQQLVAGVKPDAEVILLASEQEGITQISETLDKYRSIASVHIVSNGDSGCVALGRTRLCLENLETYEAELQSWSTILAPKRSDGEGIPILFYGCNVAAGQRGEAFITRLHQLIGTDIAASTNNTGNPALAGDWDLEVKTGPISTPLAFLPATLENYGGVLDGEFVWAKRMGGSNQDGGWGVDLDVEGNVYTTGYFNGIVDFDPGAGTFNLTSNGQNDIFISKLDNNGNFVWAKQIGGTGFELGWDISVDGSGNVYVVGYFGGTVDFDPGNGSFELTSAGNDDIFVVKLNTNGNFIWAKHMGGSEMDGAESIAIDSTGNIYITGYFFSTADFDPGSDTLFLTSTNGSDAFVSKLDNNGNLIWVEQLGGNNSAIGHSGIVSKDNNVYVTGVIGSNAFVFKLDNNGTPIFLKQMQGPGSEGAGITVDELGNIYTTGYFNGTVDFDPNNGTFNLTNTGTPDIFISKLNNMGNFVWAKQMGGGTNFSIGYQLTLDESNNLYGVGQFDNDIFITKFNSTGEMLEFVVIGGNDSDSGFDLVIDNTNNVYYTGWFGSTTDFDPGAGTFSLTSVGSGDIFVSKLKGEPPTPNLSLSKMASPNTNIAYHGLITYTITLSNSGSTATNTRLTDTLPLSTTFVQFVQQPPGGATYTPGSPEQITWTGPASANHAITLSYVTSHNGIYNDVLTNTAQFLHTTSRQSDTVTAQVMVEPPPLSIADVSAGEASGLMRFEVSLPAISRLPVSIQYSTNDGTATAGNEYTAISGTLTIPAGALTETIVVNIADDNVAESNKTFTVELSNPTQATIAKGQATGTILDDETAQIRIGDVSLNEGNAGTVGATFPVTLSLSSSEIISVAYQTLNDTAMAGSDYLTKSGILTFNPFQTAQVITITVKGDVIAEDNEGFFVNLSNAVNANIARGEGVGTILDDDLAGLGINPPIEQRLTITEGNYSTYHLNLNTQPQSAITVTLSTDGQTSVSPTQLKFTPINWTQPQTVTVMALTDQLEEGAHAGLITHTLSGDDPIYASLNPMTLTVNLFDPNISTEQNNIYLPLILK